MKLSRTTALRLQSAFTLVEIAICLAVIGFALVAVIGVLPVGLNVQTRNRQETIINHEAAFYMDAIRSGARGLNDLTNYVYAITNYWTVYKTDVTPWVVDSSGINGFSNNVSSITRPSPNVLLLTNGANIVGVLSTPKFIPEIPSTNVNAVIQSNYVVAYVRAMTGSATEQPPQTNASIRDLSFAYRMIVEIYPVPTADTNSVFGQRLQSNLHEVRLTFRWPVFFNGNSGNERQTFRTLAGGSMTNQVDQSPLLWFFQPQIYSMLR